MRASHTDKFITAIIVATFFFLRCPQTMGDEPLKPITAFAKDSRVLFQGDSITDGKRGRSPDPNHILGHGYVFIIAAKYGAGFAELNLDFVNRGVSGNTVLDLEKRWQTDTLDLKPDLLCVLIGVNDNGHQIMADERVRTVDRFWPD